MGKRTIMAELKYGIYKPDINGIMKLTEADVTNDNQFPIPFIHEDGTRAVFMMTYELCEKVLFEGVMELRPECLTKSFNHD